MHNNEINISYLAGIIDGEGCIGIECMAPCQKTNGTWIRKYHYYTPRLTVINTSYKLMERLVNTFGGKFDIRKNIPGRKTCYRWHIFGENLHNAIEKLIPYLFIKYDQAQLVIKFRQTVGKTGPRVTEEILKIRRDLYLQCRELNKVGS